MMYNSFPVGIKIYNILMTIFEIFLIAVALSMDAFAVSIISGIGLRPFHWGRALKMALFFGGFQFLMPVFGWLAGTAFKKTIILYAPWIAFILLLFIGGKMIKESFEKEEEKTSPFDTVPLLGLAVATSIDAMATGITFLGLQVPILSSSALIGMTTFAISAAGVRLGNAGFSRLGKGAEIAGGIILIVIGIKILID